MTAEGKLESCGANLHVKVHSQTVGAIANGARTAYRGRNSSPTPSTKNSTRLQRRLVDVL